MPRGGSTAGFDLCGKTAATIPQRLARIVRLAFCISVPGHILEIFAKIAKRLNKGVETLRRKTARH